jgi:hypothetical protein
VRLQVGTPDVNRALFAHFRAQVAASVVLVEHCLIQVDDIQVTAHAPHDHIDWICSLYCR